MNININKALTEEAVRLLNISDEPDLYHRVRRWARLHIKGEQPDPIDRINWPKGCLMCGLMHKALKLKGTDNSMGRATSVYAMASVQDYLDRWIHDGAPVYYIDDCMAGQALLELAEVYRNEDADLHSRYTSVADGMMKRLFQLDEKWPDAIPYRPAHGDGTVFADGIGMLVPFAIRYGLMTGNDDAIDLGLRQVSFFMENALSGTTGLPMHYYTPGSSAKADSQTKTWGRALGWVQYGLGAAMEALREYEAISPMEIKALKTIHGYLDSLSTKAREYRRNDGLWGSVIEDPDAPPDTSASAMILYALDETDESLRPFITASGRVTGAQGECMGPGVYSDRYDSYPWSVGMALML